MWHLARLAGVAGKSPRSPATGKRQAGTALG